MKTANQRLLALDAMRGLTIVVMIIVNNPIWGTEIYAQLKHSLWNGITIADVVFPWFVLLMGVSIAFSLRRYGYRLCGAAVRRIVKRAVLIFVVGIALDLAEKLIGGGLAGVDFGHLRIMGVLPRLALTYGVAALLALWLGRSGIKWIIGIFLTAYAIVLLIFRGFEPSADNIVALTDLAVFGENHMYHLWLPERTAFDPEGLLGTIPSVAHALIGYLFGLMLLDVKDNTRRMSNLLLYGSLLALTGFVLSWAVPINKTVWSPTLVLLTCGLGAQMLGVMIWVIDIKGHGAWTPALTVFGVNPLFLYVLSSLLGCLMWIVDVYGVPLPHWAYGRLAGLFGEASAVPSLIYSIVLTAVCWLIGYPLWRRKIYIKL